MLGAVYLQDIGAENALHHSIQLEAAGDGCVESDNEKQQVLGCMYSQQCEPKYLALEIRTHLH